MDTSLLEQAAGANGLRHCLRLLAVPRAVLELDRGQVVLARVLDDVRALTPRVRRLDDDLVLDPTFVKGFLDGPARADLESDEPAAVELDRYERPSILEAPTIASSPSARRTSAFPLPS